MRGNTNFNDPMDGYEQQTRSRSWRTTTVHGVKKRVFDCQENMDQITAALRLSATSPTITKIQHLEFDDESSSATPFHFKITQGLKSTQ